MHNNPYEPPRSSLTDEPRRGERIGGNLEDALAGRYQFAIAEILEEAWRLTSGAKGTIWLAMLILIGVSLAFGVADSIVRALFPDMLAGLVGGGLNIVSSLVTAPVSAGLALLGARRAAGLVIEPQSVMQHFDKMLACFLVAILTGLAVIVPALLGAYLIVVTQSALAALALIPALYIVVSFQFAPLLVLEKGLRPLEAMRISWVALNRQIARIMVFYLALWLGVGALAVMSLGIGVIWLMPLVVIAQGILYRQIFGVEIGDPIPPPSSEPPSEGRMTA